MSLNVWWKLRSQGESILVKKRTQIMGPLSFPYANAECPHCDFMDDTMFCFHSWTEESTESLSEDINGLLSTLFGLNCTQTHTHPTNVPPSMDFQRVILTKLILINHMHICFSNFLERPYRSITSWVLFSSSGGQTSEIVASAGPWDLCGF